MNIHAVLDGHEFDLAVLAERFPTGDPKVIRSDDWTVLESKMLDAVDFTDSARLVEVASSVLARLNGSTVLDTPGYRPVKLRNRFHRHPPTGTLDTTVGATDDARLHEGASIVVVASVEARLSVNTTIVGTAVGSVPGPPVLGDGAKQLAIAAAHSDADDLLVVLGSTGNLGWDILWKAMEIVRNAVGGTKDDLVAKGWITSDDFVAFRYSANHPDASGSQARHARHSPTTPPDQIMSLDDGQRWIRDLARKWLASLP